MKRSRSRNKRKAAALVEMALVIPLIFLLFFAALEFCRVAMIRHTADNAVYEGCRVGIIPGAESGEVETEATRIMSTIGVTDFDIKITPKSIKRETEEITVRVEVSIDGNSFVPNQFFAGKTIIRELTMRREGVR